MIGEYERDLFHTLKGKGETVKLFQYCVFYAPQGRPNEALIILPPATILARSEKSVLLQVLRDLPEKWKADIDSVEVAVRPF